MTPRHRYSSRQPRKLPLFSQLSCFSGHKEQTNRNLWSRRSHAAWGTPQGWMR